MSEFFDFDQAIGELEPRPFEFLYVAYPKFWISEELSFYVPTVR